MSLSATGPTNLPFRSELKWRSGRRSSAQRVYRRSETYLRGFEQSAKSVVGLAYALGEGRSAVIAEKLLRRVNLPQFSTSIRGILRPGQRGRAAKDLAARIVAPAIRRDLRDELLRIPRQEPPRIPSDALPFADRHAAVSQRQGANDTGRCERIRGKDPDSVVGRRQRHDGLRRGAFQQHARLNIGQLTGDIEPRPRSKAALQQQQGLLGQLSDLKNGAAPEAVLGRQRRDEMYGIERLGSKARAFRTCRDHEVAIAAFEPAMKPDAAILHKLHLDAGMAAPVRGQEIRKHILDRVGRRSDPKEARLPSLERAGVLA